MKSRGENIQTLWIKKYDLTPCENEKIQGKVGYRYIRDSVVMITLRNRSGMEGARIYIYRDSAFIYNRVNKTYFPVAITERVKEKQQAKIRDEGVGLLRRNEQRKYFEYYLGKGNKIAFYVKKYLVVRKGYYIPGDVTIKALFEGRSYCYRLVAPVYQTNVPVNVKRMGSNSKYRKVRSLDEAL